jgi:hypothetical protein
LSEAHLVERDLDPLDLVAVEGDAFAGDKAGDELEVGGVPGDGGCVVAVDGEVGEPVASGRSRP